MITTVFNKLELAIQKISHLADLLSRVLLLVLVLLTAEQVVARYIFSASSIAFQELEWHLFGFVFLLSMAHTLQVNGHVRVDIFYAKFSERKKAVIDIFGILFFLIPASLLLIYYGVDFVSEALKFNNSRAPDYYSSWLSSNGSFLYQILSPIEALLRKTILIGEISANPGGLEARWIIKAAIPFAFLLLFAQSLSLLVKKLSILLKGS